MPHEPLSDTDVAAIVNFDRVTKETALAVEVQRRRADERLLQDIIRRTTDFSVPPGQRADPAVVIPHLAHRIEVLHGDISRVRDLLEQRDREHREEVERLNTQFAAAHQRAAELEAPLPLILYCPLCHTRHIDEGEQTTKPHRTHACQNPRCGHLWAPAVVPTVGVWTLPGCLNTVELVAPLEAVAFTDARVDRIKRHRADRGAADALSGQPPTEANAEYQAGYVDAAKRAREISGVKSVTSRFDVGKSLDKRPGQASVEIDGLSDDRELVRKLDAGVGRITEALGFAPGGADFDAMVDAIRMLKMSARVAEAQVVDSPLGRSCPTCLATVDQPCHSSPPCTVGDHGPEFHEARCWRPLTVDEADRLGLPCQRRGVWHRWGDQLKTM